MFPVVLLFIFFLSFFLRASGFFHNYPFWVDEFSTAVQSQFILKYGLSVFSNPNIYFEHHNILIHFVVALLFKVLGQNEWVARLPSLFIGSLIPLAVFSLTKYIFDRKTAVLAALLTTFSYFEIVWSRQARSYAILQFIIILATYFYFKIAYEKKERKKVYIIFLSILLVLGFISHSFFYIFIGSLLIDLLISHAKDLSKIFLRWWFYPIVVILSLLIIKIGIVGTFIHYLNNGGFGANNLWYYHAFLWREYGLVTFLSLLGGIVALVQKNKFIFLIGIYSLLHLIFITFIFAPYSSRYILPVYPFMLILMGYFFSELSEIVLRSKSRFFRSSAAVILVLFIVVNGHKFVNRPKKFYSVNHDFRDIALIDYHVIYDLIEKKGEIEKQNTAIIETWTARTYWYLGIDYKPTYFFKWPGNLPYFVNGDGEKVVPRNNNVRLIENLSDLKRTMAKYPKGFILIDDSSLPKDVLEYSEKKLKKELYLDHYPLDENPYSIWPATLYSWGVK